MYLVLTIALSLSVALFSFLTSKELVVIVPYGIVIPLLVLIPRFVIQKVVRTEGNDWLKRSEAAAFLIVLCNAPASLFFHDMGFQYDRFLHFSMGVVLTPAALIMAMLFFRKMEKEISKKSALWLTAILAFIGLFAWEGFQYFLDLVFGTKLFYDSVQPIVVDFWEDIFFGFAGVLLGLWYSNRSFDKLKV